MYVEGVDRMTCILNAAQFLRDAFASREGCRDIYGLGGLFASYKRALKAGYNDLEWDGGEWGEAEGNEYIGSICRQTADGGDDILDFTVHEGAGHYRYMGDWALRDGPKDKYGNADIEFWAGRVERGEFYQTRYRVTPRKGSSCEVKDFKGWEEANKYADANDGWAEQYIVGVTG